MFGFFRNRRRRRLLAEPFPNHWDVVLRRNVGHYSRLSETERSQLRDVVRVLVAEKEWEAARGFHLTEEMKLTVAAQAGLMLLGVPDHDYFDRVKTIVLHPSSLRRPDPEDPTIEDDVTDEVVDGLAVYRGPVVVAWDRALDEGRDPTAGHNLVIHEFAHQLDFLDDLVDGTPPLATPAAEARWRSVMDAALKRHQADLKAGATETFFSEQAGDDGTEFFADVAEAFFCAPTDLHTEAPAVYDLMVEFFRVDPRRWFAAE